MAKSLLRTRRRSTVRTYRYKIVIHPNDPDERGFWAEVPVLPGCVSQGDTFQQCMENAQEAIEGYLEALVKLKQEIPEEPERDDSFVGTVQVRVKAPA